MGSDSAMTIDRIPLSLLLPLVIQSLAREGTKLGNASLLDEFGVLLNVSINILISKSSRPSIQLVIFFLFRFILLIPGEIRKARISRIAFADETLQSEQPVQLILSIVQILQRVQFLAVRNEISASTLGLIRWPKSPRFSLKFFIPSIRRLVRDSGMSHADIWILGRKKSVMIKAESTIQPIDKTPLLIGITEPICLLSFANLLNIVRQKGTLI